MRIPNLFNDIIKKHLKVHAAWLPVTNNFTLGDYGIISDGVFAKMGNIQEFNVPFTAAEGPDASIDFTSADTTVTLFDGGTQVEVIPEGSLDARITFKFGNEKSFLVKAPVIKVRAIQDLNQVAQKLKVLEAWGKKWKIVHQIYEAWDPLLVSTIAANTEIKLSGKAEALKSFKVADASLNLSTTKELGLKIHGKNGIIGLGLFRLRRTDIEFLGQEYEIIDVSSPVEEDL